MNVEALRELCELIEAARDLARQLSDETFQTALDRQSMSLAHMVGALGQVEYTLGTLSMRGQLRYYEHEKATQVEFEIGGAAS